MKPDLHIDEYLRYADSVWDMRRINNINQHFVTAFLDLYVKDDERYTSYLNVHDIEEGQEWPGFKPRTTVGLELEHFQPTE